MNASKVSTSSTLSKSSENPQMHEFKTIPIHSNLQESMEVMTEEQINFNLIQLNLVSMFNKEILDKMYAWSVDPKFYLKNRYLLENILNVAHKPTSAPKTDVKEIVEKYDTSYVNGKPFHAKSKDSHIIKHGLKKEERAKFISSREEFVSLLEELSEQLKVQEKNFEDEEDLMEYFKAQLDKINKCQIHTTISPNKMQLMKNASMESLSSHDSGDLEEISNDSQNFQTPKKQKPGPGECIFTICYHGELYPVKEIIIENSRFVRTKNRFPLILDLGFSKFIYKNDNQLSHELIAMSLMKYINRIITGLASSYQIIEYEIIPESTGAFYQFVENSMTIGKIKSKFPGGIPEYLDHLEEKQFENSHHQMSNIRKRFAETYAGFCIAQYLLDLKDRNNENIMIRADGAIFHIDLAFIFNAHPGNIGFETAPFKFPQQYLDAMGGFDSDTFKYYQSLMMSNLTKLCINKHELFTKIQILAARKDEILCFKKYKVDSFKQKIPKHPKQVKKLVEKLIDASYDNWRTKKYDDYQFKTNGILN